MRVPASSYFSALWIIFITNLFLLLVLLSISFSHSTIFSPIYITLFTSTHIDHVKDWVPQVNYSVMNYTNNPFPIKKKYPENVIKIVRKLSRIFFHVKKMSGKCPEKWLSGIFHIQKIRQILDIFQTWKKSGQNLDK